MESVNEAFIASDVNGDGLLDRDEFKSFTIRMDARGVEKGLKHREITEDWIDMVYRCFNGYTRGRDGVSK